ncbi:MAG: hypothetical protein RLZZ393_770, partial [Pseudomonadota bacterium]
SVIRVNSQSGKGGMAWLLERDHGLVLPRRLQIEFSPVVQRLADSSGREVGAADIWALFEQEYLRADGDYQYQGHQRTTAARGGDDDTLSLEITCGGRTRCLTGRGNGPIDALVHALDLPFDILSFEEKSMGSGSEAKAVAFVEITTSSRVTLFGAGIHANTVTASLMAVLSAVRRATARGLLEATA